MRQKLVFLVSKRVCDCVMDAVVSTALSQLKRRKFHAKAQSREERTQRKDISLCLLYGFAPLRESSFVYRFCHCVTTKQEVSLVCSLLTNGSSRSNTGAKNFLVRGGMRKINEFKTSRKAKLPRYFAFRSSKQSLKSLCKAAMSIAASLSEKKRSNRYHTRLTRSGSEPLCGSMKQK